MPVLCPILRHDHAVPTLTLTLVITFLPALHYCQCPVGPWPSEKQLLLPTSQLTLGDLELAHDHPGPPPGHSSPIPCPFLSILALSLFQTHLSPIPDTGEYLVTYAEECGTTQDEAF